MKIEKIICDCCGEEIPKVKKKDIFGVEREAILQDFGISLHSA